MQAKRGIAWLVTACWMVLLAITPGLAAPDYLSQPPPFLTIDSQNSLEAQMLGEKPLKAATSHFPAIEAIPSLQLHGDSDASLKLPRNLELNISIRYNRDPSPAEPPRLKNPTLYMKYAMDYRVLSNLRVGLNSYLYRPAEEGFAFQRPMANQLMGVGPELKYDLGRWSFLLKSQMQSGNQDQGKDLQNWFRVWYAF
jgi:hypothetical protein